jgi:hypothetical protein
VSRRIDDDERRARLGRRHHLTVPAPSVEAAAADLLGLHSSDPVSVYLSARARGFDRPGVDAALYERRSLVRLVAMRRTLWVEPDELVPVVDVACSKAVGAAERKRLLGWLTEAGLGGKDPGRWLRKVERATLEALADGEDHPAAQLTKAVPDLARKITVGSGKWRQEMGLTTRVLWLLAMDARIVRSRPRGTWISNQYLWRQADEALGDLTTADARTELVRRWLAAYGPGTTDDIAWWTGLGKTPVRAALKAVGAIEVALAAGPGWVLPDDLDPVEAPDPWVALLPALDPTTMGWKQRDWYLGEHGPPLFDRNGNAGPAVWVDGRIVGGWGQDANGIVRIRFLEEVGKQTAMRIEAEAERLTAWYEGVKVAPRFRTPIERELSETTS